MEEPAARKFPERLPARKVPIADLTAGQWVKKEGFEPSFLLTQGGEQVGRARVLGTVVGSFINEEKTFSSLTLDDGTDTIRTKVFKDLSPLAGLNVGDVIDVVGRVREFNGEIYLNTETAARIPNMNIELLRAAELLGRPKITPVTPAQVEGARATVLKVIEQHPDGIRFEEVFGALKLAENEVEQAISDLLAEGVCYEPTPGRIRKI